MSKIKAFIVESYQEMRNKVSWSKYTDLQNSSILVLVTSLIFALIIGLIDMVFENSMGWFYDAF